MSSVTARLPQIAESGVLRSLLSVGARVVVLAIDTHVGHGAVGLHVRVNGQHVLRRHAVGRDSVSLGTMYDTMVNRQSVTAAHTSIFTFTDELVKRIAGKCGAGR